jgi:poly-gamma-glutamate synthesis protein (capsule biosynthesis protein)
MKYTILIAGDYCPHGRVADFVGNGDYERIFSQVKSLTQACDYSIVNFECPVLATEGVGIKKAGPSLKCSPEAVDALKYAGFECATLANNHFYDQGEEGVRETIRTLTEAGIAYVGGGENLHQASHTLYHEINGKTLAIINCCEHEFSIATDTTGGSNPLNPIGQFYAIKEAKEMADYVIVIVHGGIEHYQYPTQRMVDTYRFFVDAGADAVINHHQHCFSGCEVWNGKPIFYGLGNFCFDWRERSSKLWVEGYMVKLILEDDRVGYELLPYTQNENEPGVYPKMGEAYNEWKSRFDAISEVVADRGKLEAKYKELLTKTERIYSTNLTPYASRFTLALYMRHLLPMLMSKRKLRTLLNMLMCESHYDRMMRMLKNYSK